MLATATIVFREFLEIALILSIIMAATKGLKNRGMLVVSGLLIGVFGAAVLAFFTDSISNAIDGVGQEIFNAGIMFTAAGFLCWTLLWMKKHGREMAMSIRARSEKVANGSEPYSVIVLVIALATLREGAEIVLFTYGATLSGVLTLSDILMGGILGAVGGTLMGIMIYMGLLQLTKNYMLKVTSWILVLLTAGMAAQGARFLVMADVLPALNPQLWDTSHIIESGSLLGEMLGVLVGYTAQPSGIEVVFYAAVIVFIVISFNMTKLKPKQAAVAHIQA